MEVPTAIHTVRVPNYVLAQVKQYCVYLITRSSNTVWVLDNHSVWHKGLKGKPR